MAVPGRGGWGGWQSRETNIRERLRDIAELDFHMSLSSRSAQGGSQGTHISARRMLRGRSEALRGRSEELR